MIFFENFDRISHFSYMFFFLPFSINFDRISHFSYMFFFFHFPFCLTLPDFFLISRNFPRLFQTMKMP